MHVDVASGRISHHTFTDLPGFLDQRDLMVFNNTRVIPARMFGSKETGGRVEVLLERIVTDHEAIAQIRASKPSRAGSLIRMDEGGPVLTVLGREGDFYRLGFPSPGVLAIAQQHGHMPLPPYIDRPDEGLDQERYQTVYAKHPGAVAAPPAGLHFDEAMLDETAAAGSPPR